MSDEQEKAPDATKIVRYYHAEKNKGNAWHTGIPTRDLTEACFARLSDRQKAIVDGKDSWWSKTKPRDRTKEHEAAARPPWIEAEAPTESPVVEAAPAAVEG